MRLFVAIQLSEEMKKSITQTMHDLKKAGVRGSYVPTRNLHLTLAFLGEVDNVSVVREALQRVKVEPFRLSLAEMGTFGDLLWVDLGGCQKLNAVIKDVRAALDQAQISYDKKRFVPHITIIRKMNGRWKQTAAPRGEMMVKQISLMKSEVKDGKRVYTEVSGVNENRPH